MKKVLVLGLLMLLTTGLMAQKNSGFFSTKETGEEFLNRDHAGDEPEPGGGHGGDNPNPDPGVSPLGSGLLILAGLSAGYVYLKRNKKE